MAVEGVGPQRAAQLAHRGGGLDAAAGTSPMTSSRRPPGWPARRTSRRRPASPRRRAGSGRRDDARRARAALGQQALLQLLGDGVLALEGAHALDGQRGAVGGQPEQRRVGGAEAAREQRADVERADRPALDDERHAEHRGDRLAERMRRPRGLRPQTSSAEAGRPSATTRWLMPPGATFHCRFCRPATSTAPRPGRPRGPALLVQHDRRGVGGQHVGGALQQLAHERLEVHGAQRHVGDALHHLQAAR